MIELLQQTIMDLFVEKLLQLGCKKVTKTVNRTDPTEVTTIKGQIGMEYGLDISRKSWEPEPQIIDINVVQTPYGTEFNYAVFVEGEGAMEWQSGYLDDDNKWHRVTGEDFFRHLKRMINEAISAKAITVLMVLNTGYEGDFYHDHLADHE